jgi:5'-nucleotidase
MSVQILLTNDDGVRSEGIRVLAEALRRFGGVTTVAPSLEVSAVSHGLTLNRPLRLDRMAPDVFSVDGTPTDCINIAMAQILSDQPDLVVSGINKGWNVGDDVTYSGTVAGALEGVLLGVPSLAVSLERTDGMFDFSQAAEATAAVADVILRQGLPSRTLLNINVPKARARGFRVTVQAKRSYASSVRKSIDPRGSAYYWIGEGQYEWESNVRSDYQAVKEGWISVTPLQPDLTDHTVVGAVESTFEKLSLGKWLS